MTAAEARDEARGSPMLPDRFRAALPYLLFAISAAIVYPVRFLKSGLFDGGDDLLSNLPFLVHSAKKLFSLEIFWTERLWLGTPLLDEPEFGTFYLPRLVLLVLPLIPAYVLYVLLHYALAQSGFYLYARGSGISRLGATFGALAYGFSGFMLGHRGHSMYIAAGAWAPFVLHFLNLAEREPKKRYFAGAALSFAALPLAGAYQLTFYCASLVAGVAVLRALMDRDPRHLVAPALGLVSGLLIAAPQLVPSLAFAHGLVATPRHDEAFANLMSYDPRILPLLVIPESPLANAETYSRIGGVVLVFAALGAGRRGSSFVRVWTIVAVVSLVLMLGRFVPGLPGLLRTLPVVGVFRGPVRHNFELGIATSVLAAVGFDVAFRDRAASRLRWIVAGLASMAALALFARFMMRHLPAQDDIKAMVVVLKPWNVAWGVVTVGAGSAAIAFARSPVRWLSLAVVAAPLVEAWVSARPLDRTWPDRAAALSSLEKLDGPGRRILPPPAIVGGMQFMSEDTAALLSNSQALCGYASMSPADAVEMFDLDMLGHPRDDSTLAWSRLPSIFGVTHLILPEAICDPIDVIADPRLPGGACALAPANVPGAPSVECTHELGSGISRFGVGIEAYTRDDEFSFEVRAEGTGRETGRKSTLAIDPGSRRRKWFNGAAIPGSGTLSVVPVGGRMLRARKLSLIEDRLETIAVLDGRTTPTTNAPSGPRPVVAQAPVHFPEGFPRSRRDDPPFRLYAVARRLSEDNAGFTLEPTDVPDGDPKRALLDIDGKRLGPEFGAFGRFVHFSRAVDTAIRVARAEDVFVDRAEFLAARRRALLDLTAAQTLSGNDLSTDGGILLDATGFLTARYHLPVRPVTLTVESDAVATGVAYGVAYDKRLQVPPVERRVPLLAPGHGASFTVDAPAEATRLLVHARNSGAVGLHVRATSACSLRKYTSVATLGGGFSLYENHDAMPRAFTVSTVRSVGSTSEARDVLRDDAAFDPRTTALVQGAAPGALGPGDVISAHFSAQRVDVDVRASSDRPTLLVVNDRFSPGFRATLDGRPTTIQRVNGLVRGVVVPPGVHIVVMYYEVPKSFLLGVLLAAIGLGLVAVSDRAARRFGSVLHSS